MTQRRKASQGPNRQRTLRKRNNDPEIREGAKRKRNNDQKIRKGKIYWKETSNNIAVLVTHSQNGQVKGWELHKEPGSRRYSKRGIEKSFSLDHFEDETCIYPIEEYLKQNQDQRAANYYYIGGDPPLCTTCGSIVTLELDHTFCHNCEALYHDSCLFNGTIIDRGGTYTLLGAEEPFECPSCFKTLKSSKLEKPVKAVTNNSKQVTVAVDIGTRTVRVTVIVEGTDQPLPPKAYPSLTQIKGRDNYIHAQGELAGQSGDLVYPLKSLLFTEEDGVNPRDQATREILAKHGIDGSVVFADAIHHIVAKRLEELGKMTTLQLDGKYDLKLALSLPCCLSPTRQSSFFSQFMSQTLEQARSIRLIPLPEPVAAFIACKAHFRLGEGKYLVFDLGATTGDMSVVRLGSNDEITVEWLGGLALGLDTVDMSILEEIKKEKYDRTKEHTDIAIWRSFQSWTDDGKVKAPETNLEIFDFTLTPKHFNQLWEKYSKDLKEHVAKVIKTCPPEKLNDVGKLCLCGGAANHDLLGEIANHIFPGIPVVKYSDPDERSGVMAGALLAARDVDEKHRGSMNIVLEMDSPDAMQNEGSSHKEYLVLHRAGQHFQSPKRTDAEHDLQSRSITFEIELGDEDLCSRLLSAPGKLDFQMNTADFLVAIPPNSETFTELATIIFTKDTWKSQLEIHPRRALQVIFFKIDIPAGILSYDHVLLGRPPSEDDVNKTLWELRVCGNIEEVTKYASRNKLRVCGKQTGQVATLDPAQLGTMSK